MRANEKSAACAMRKIKRRTRARERSFESADVPSEAERIDIDRLEPLALATSVLDLSK
jgi:hypothetical protein